MWVKLLIIMIVLWVLQGFLTVFQLMNLKKRIGELEKYGHVGMGAVKGRFKAGTMVLVAGNEDGEIVEAQLMQGRTIFAKFKPYQEIIGLKYWDVLAESKEKEGNLSQALTRAIKSLEQKYEEEN